MESKRERIISWWLYSPGKGRYDIPVDPECCRAEVWGADSYRPHQCSRKATQAVEGYGACKQHAQKLQERLKYEAES